MVLKNAEVEMEALTDRKNKLVGFFIAAASTKKINNEQVRRLSAETGGC